VVTYIAKTTEHGELKTHIITLKLLCIHKKHVKQLKTNITRAIKEENERTLRKVARNMVKRVDKCIEMNVHHFQHLL